MSSASSLGATTGKNLWRKARLPWGGGEVFSLLIYEKGRSRGVFKKGFGRDRRSYRPSAEGIFHPQGLFQNTPIKKG